MRYNTEFDLIEETVLNDKVILRRDFEIQTSEDKK